MPTTSFRGCLNERAPQAMVVLSPIIVKIANMASQIKPTYIEVADFPDDPRSPKHMISLEREIFIERADFREDTSDATFRFLTPKQMVRLSHTGVAIELKEIHRNAEGAIDYLTAIRHPIESLAEKPKASISWVSMPLTVQVRLNPEDTKKAPETVLADISVKYAQPSQQFQFERVGTFSVDSESRIGKLIFNRTVSLK